MTDADEFDQASRLLLTQTSATSVRYGRHLPRVALKPRTTTPRTNQLHAQHTPQAFGKCILTLRYPLSAKSIPSEHKHQLPLKAVRQERPLARDLALLRLPVRQLVLHLGRCRV